MKRPLFVTNLSLLLVSSIVACASPPPPPPVTVKAAPGGSKSQAQWPADDQSMCDWRNKPELEVSETAGPGAMKANIRRVYKIVGDADDRHKALICREVDTNLDGVKDIARTFNAKGEAIREMADTDYDGKLDVWLAFSKGRVVEEIVDDAGDGKPHVWKAYLDGQLSRIKRDTNGDGKPDVWEIYTKGRLERMGVDQSSDGHVDVWLRDELWRKQIEDEDSKALLAKTDGGAGADAGDGGESGDGGAKGKRKEGR